MTVADGPLPSGHWPENLTLPKPSSRERQLIVSFLDHLASNPYQTGDYEETDDTGRPVQIKIISNFALTYWSDHASKEVKVIKVEKADRD